MGSGQDTIHDYDTTAGNTDTIRLVGLNLAQVTLQRDGKDFLISVNGTSDVLRVADWGLGAAYRIERLQFADGSVLEGAALVAPFLGTTGNDTLTGTADADLLMGLEGNDVLSGGAGDDVARRRRGQRHAVRRRQRVRLRPQVRATTSTCSAAAPARTRSTTTTPPPATSTPFS